MKNNHKMENLDSTSESGIVPSHSNIDYKSKLDKINKIIYNLDQYSNGYNFGYNFEYEQDNLNMVKRGGNIKNTESDTDNNTITITLKKYNKIKTFAKVAKNTVIKYKNLAQYYLDSYNSILVNYDNLLKILYVQKQNLENKLNEYAKLSRDYTNGIDKIKLLETMIDGIEKVVDKTTNLDLEIKNKFNGKDFNIKADAKLYQKTDQKLDKSIEHVKILDNTIMLGGTILNSMYRNLHGGMDYYEFARDIESLNTDLETYGKELDADNQFINKKVESLHTRVKNIMESSEELLNIRLNIEWIVNQLEKPNIVEEQEAIESIDYTQIYEKLKATIDNVKNKKTDPNIAKYIRELESMAKYFEDFIASNKETLGNMPVTERNKMLQTLEKLKGISKPNNDVKNNNVESDEEQDEEDFQDAIEGPVKKEEDGDETDNEEGDEEGNSKYKKIIIGGGLQDDYDNINKNKICKINEQFANAKLNVVFIGSNNEPVESMIKYSNVDGLEIYQDKLYQIFVMASELNKILELFKKYWNNFEPLKLNLVYYWDKLFANKNTNFYNKVKDFEIINLVSNTNGSNFIIKAGDFITTIKESANEYKFYIQYSIESLDKTIEQIDKTITFYNIFIFVMVYIRFFYWTVLNDNEKFNKFGDLIMLYENLTKSNTLIDFEKYYDFIETKITKQTKTQGGGNNLTIYNILSDDEITSILKPGINKISDPIIQENVLSDLYEKFNNSFSKLIGKIKADTNYEKFIGDIYIDIGITMIKENKELTRTMIGLFQKISVLLGKPIPIIPYIPKNVMDELGVGTILDLVKERQKIPQIGGEITIRPRVTPYKIALKNCLENLKPLYLDSAKIERILDKKVKPENSYGEPTQTLTTLYSKLEENLNIGTNSYINVNPIIFFTIEFPPDGYKNDECKFVFEYKDQKILYKPPNDKCIKKINSTYKFDITNKPKELNSNQAFLKSTGNNTTASLMTDKIIGLEKLIDSKPSLNPNVPIPTQKVINLMFALGASGTGKTTRYFGYTKATEQGDKEGIVQGIIKKASGTNTGEEQITIQLGYFVCYGRKKDIGFNSSKSEFDDNISNVFDELVIFVDVEKVNKKMNDENFKEFDDDDFFIFKEPNPNANNINVQTYTDFYSQIVSKKLQRIQYSSIKDYITNGGKFPDTLNTDTNKETNSFREIIEPLQEENKTQFKSIWKTITEEDKLIDLFENLIKAQKCIRTVLPTKNNIESSRGHTCVLIKIISGKEIKYFPLFDMAGTENVISMNEFFTLNRNTERINKLIGIISDLSKTNAIRDNKLKKENKFFASLNDVLKNYKIEGYVKIQKGGKGEYNIDDANKGIEQIENNYKSITGTNLIQKILGEGYYINHTIGMLIYVAKCVGCSINSPMIGNEDKFDSIGTDVVDEMNKYIMYYNGEGKEQGTNEKTRVLLDSIGFNSILQKSSIWVQILFSFLYWNEENTKTFDEIINECNKTGETKPDDNDDDKQLCVYLGEQLDSKNINPSAPGNSVNYNMDGDSNKFSYNTFFNNFYSIQELKMNPIETIKKINIKDKINELSNLYTNVLQKPETVKYILKTEEKEKNKLVFTNDTIEAYKTYIYNDNLYSNENFYKVLQNIIDEKQDYIIYMRKFGTLSVVKNAFNDDIKYNTFLTNSKQCKLKNANCTKTNNEYIIDDNNETNDIYLFSLNNLRNLTEVFSDKLRTNAFIIDCIVEIVQTVFPTIIINNKKFVKENILMKDKKYGIQIVKTDNKLEFYKQPDLLQQLFPYDENNQKIFKNYIDTQQNNINTTLAKEYKKEKEKFTKLIEYENPILYQISKNFNTNLYVDENSNIKFSENGKKLTEIIENYNKLLIQYNANKPDEKNFEITVNSNQIKRIKDSRIGATKMVLMHVVTGQDYKYPMVMETIGLTNVLFEASKINLGDEQDTTESTKSTEPIEPTKTKETTKITGLEVKEGGSKYNLHQLDFNLIELID